MRLFIDCEFNEQPAPSNNYGWIRLGIAYLSSSLRAQGHEVGLLDFRYLKGWREVIPAVEKFAPDMVSISAITMDAQNAIRCGQMIKQHNPAIVTCVGGIHASIAPEDFENAGCFDFVVRGEGEVTVPWIANVFGPDGLKLFTTRTATMWGETPDLNALPFPDRELWPNYRKIISTPNHLKLEIPWLQMIANRGCPYSCSFCCGPGEKNHFTREVNGKRVPYVRGRSVENVIKEMDALKYTYDIKSIQFMDDQFIMNTDWMWAFCKDKEEWLPETKYWAASRADIILRNKPLIERMHDTGLDIMSVGFESFSNHLLKFWNKGVTAEQNYEAAEFLNDIGVRIFSNTIFGAPREDGKWYIEDDLANIEAIEKIQPATASKSIFNPIIGSELYQWAIDKNLIDKPMTGAHNTCLKGVNQRKIRLIMDRAYCDRPWHHRAFDTVMDMVEDAYVSS
jgi:anaerobic magnesium-protoporphyrin IX monomethyl ester cyclase